MKLLKPVMAYLRFQGVRTVIYLDDILILAENRDTLLHQMHCTVQLLEQLGFTINLPKSALELTSQIVYLGLLIDSMAMKLHLPEEKVQQITNNCSQVLSKEVTTAQVLASLIGKLSAARPAVLPAPLQLWYLHRVGFLHLTSDTEPGFQGRAEVVDPPQDLIIQSDASLKGWGAMC